MRSRVDQRLRQEAADFRLRFGCEHCVYFEVVSASCSEGFPNEEHLSVELEKVNSVCFCKKYELG